MMRPLLLALLVLMTALLAPGAARAQQRISPMLGVTFGVTGLPDPLVESCSSDGGNYPAASARLGAARGAWAVQVEASAFGALTVDDCLTLGPAHEAGVHTDRLYEAGRGHGDVSVSAQLRHRIAERWSLGLGGGRLRGAGAPFALAAVAFRSHAEGRGTALVELERWAVRLPYDEVTARWENFEIRQVLERESRASWHAGYALRLAMQWEL